MRVLPGLRHHVRIGLVDAPLNGFGRKAVYRVHGQHAAAPAGKPGIECGRPVAAAQYPLAEILAGQGEHGDIFVERPPPGDNLFQ